MYCFGKGFVKVVKQDYAWTASRSDNFRSPQALMADGRLRGGTVDIRHNCKHVKCTQSLHAYNFGTARATPFNFCLEALDFVILSAVTAARSYRQPWAYTLRKKS